MTASAVLHKAISLENISIPISLCVRPIVDYFATDDTHQWREIWIIPAIIAAVVLILFLLLFKDKGTTQTPNLIQESDTTLQAPVPHCPCRETDVDLWLMSGLGRWRAD